VTFFRHQAAAIVVITRRFFFVYILLAMAAFALVVHAGLELEARVALTREHGPIETTTVLGYLIAAAWLSLTRCEDRRFAWLSTAVVLLLAARELDFNTAFTTGNLTKLSFYLDPEMPAGQKLAGVLVLLSCAWVALRYLRYAPALLQRLRRGEPFAWTIAAIAAFLPVAKLMDGAHRFVHTFTGFKMDRGERQLIGVSEEILELAIPLLMLLAIAQYALAGRRARPSGDGFGLPGPARSASD
jgi:hypothetical protein